MTGFVRVIGLMAVLAATLADAQAPATGIKLGGPQGRGYVGPALVNDRNAPLRFAAETLSNGACAIRVGRSCTRYAVTASSGELLLRAETDILLPDHGRYYVRYDFGGGALLARELATEDLVLYDDQGNTQGSVSAVAYRGAIGDDKVVFQLGSGGLPRGAKIHLDLSGSARDEDANNGDELRAGLAVRASSSFSSHTATLTVYAAIADAVNGTGAIFTAGPTAVVQTGRVVGGRIEALVANADVSTSVDDGGPFRRFVPDGTGGKDSGVLAEVLVQVSTGPPTWTEKYRNATTNMTVDDTIIASTAATATSEPGNFAIVSEGGALIRDNKKPWRLAEKPGCSGGPLDLSASGEIDTYAEDPDGPEGHLAKDDPTPDGIASANMASGHAEVPAGKTYFCVLAAGNTEPIPEVGDPDTKNAYRLTIVPQLANAEDKPVRPRAIGPAAAGAIDRNGTTVHLTYLTTDAMHGQRLVIVNRGADSARFWVGDDSFYLEDGVRLARNSLQGSVPGKGRLVLQVGDNVTFEGKTRGSATINIAAPTRDIDVMTVQSNPGTGQIDTTVYQHAE